MTTDSLKYHIYIGLFRLIALLPLRALYAVSSLICFVVHRVVRYRLRVVRTNLRNAFPEKTEKELKAIEKEFYTYLCDIIVETVKLLHISDKELMRRVEIHGTEVVKEYARQGHPIILYLGHYCNWEWVPSLTLRVDEPKVMGALYRPLRNKVMDRVMLKLRSRFRSMCIPVKEAYRMLLRIKSEGTPFMVGFIADQRPKGFQEYHHWTEFLNQNTAYAVGGETIGRRVGARYVYLDLQRIKRGYYSITFRKMDIEPFKETDYPYTLCFLSMLEDSIRKNPPYWLWSHNRWLI